MLSAGNYALPILLIMIVLFGVIRLRSGVFSAFTEGAAEGIKTVFSIAPSLIGLITAVEMFRSSGALDMLTAAVEPLFAKVGIPAETVSLILLRPISGSGSIALLDSILKNYGPDSLAGRCASVICASGETTFYACTLYYGAVQVKNIRHTMLCALLADFIGIIVSAAAVNMMFGG